MKKTVFLLALCALTMISCVPQKLVYLKDMRSEILYQVTQRPDLRIQTHDRLRIMVSSNNPELSAPFNTGVGGYQVGSDGEVRTIATTAMQEGGYLVDRQGNIEFPVLGTLRVEGLTKQELVYQIKNRLRDERHLSDALITVDVVNFKVTVVGEVGTPGIQSVIDEKVTIFDAITRAGGVTTNASMGEVVVIREDRRGYRMFNNDLRTTAIFESPTYFLQQNDVVYVRPKAAKMSEKESRSWQWFNTVLGLGGTIVSVLLLINYYK